MLCQNCAQIVESNVQFDYEVLVVNEILFVTIIWIINFLYLFVELNMFLFWMGVFVDVSGGFSVF
jgi:type III secretory pathway component EscS